MRRLTKKFVMTFHDMRMLACPSKNTVNTKSFTKCLSVVKGEAALLVNDKRRPDVQLRMAILKSSRCLGW